MPDKKYKTKNHRVFSCQYHFVICPKYRKKLFVCGIDTRLNELIIETARLYEFKILDMEVMPDHIHLLLDVSPQFCIPDMIRIMKGGIARKLFLMHPELKEKLWKGHLWNPSYCIVTVSERSREMVEYYIESQKEKEWGGPGRRPRDLERLQAYHRALLELEEGKKDKEQ